MLVDYDPDWPRLFAREASAFAARSASGRCEVEQSGSTSVPGLAAKPIVDIVLVVADSADEAAYVPALEAAGYVLRIREPDWFEHRLLKGPTRTSTCTSSLPVARRPSACSCSGTGCAATRPTVSCYERTKRELAAKEWKFTQDYADAKSEVVEAILAGLGGRRHRELA